MVTIREDTSPETPLAKSNSDPPPAPDGWRPPRDAHDAMFDAMHGGGGARMDWAFGSGKVHTFQVSGPAAWALAVVVMLAVGVFISAFFLFVLGLGTALALGAGAAAALGVGANAARKRLHASKRGDLGPDHR